MPEEKKSNPQNTHLRCNNCQHEFNGNYCPNCGQAAKNLNRPFHFVIYDFAGTVFSFDTRVWVSLRALLFSPGKLSYDFVEGKRVRYMPPFQMYVFVSFVFFLSLSIYTKKKIQPVYDMHNMMEEQDMDSAIYEIENTRYTADSNLILTPKDLNRERLNKIKAWIDYKIATDTTLKKDVIEEMMKGSRMLSDPNMFLTTVFKYVSWGLFFLMPAYALLILLFFNKKGYYYTAHLTFSIHLHTFLFLTLLFGGCMLLLFKKLPVLIIWLFILMFLCYQFIGLRRMYQQKIMITIIKQFLMNIIYAILFAVAAVIIIVVAYLNF